jgi:hypothetical protein
MPVEFEQNNDFRRSFAQEQNSSGMSRFLIKNGLAKDTDQSNIILISVCIIFIIITSIILYNTFKSPSSNTNSPNALIIKSYIDQGLKGKALIDRLNQDRAAGLIK